MINFGQEKPTETPVAVRFERSPTSRELELWNKAENFRRRVVLLSHAVKLQYNNVIIAAKFAKNRSVNINFSGLPEIEKRMSIALSEIEKLRLDQCDVSGMKLGISPASDGNDLNIVRPNDISFGLAWIPIAIGAVVVAGIIARWAYLEKEVIDISEQYNGVLWRADQKLCEDPESPLCADWEATKLKGGYHKNKTLVDSIKSAVGQVGSFASKGLGIGVAIAIPLLMMFLLPQKKG